MSEQYYSLGTNTAEQWQELHAELIADGNTYASVPSREVTVEDEKLHSATRGSYLLTDEEATALESDPRVKFINIDYSKYPETYKAPPDELYASAPKNFNRYKNNVKVYKEMETSNSLPGTPDATDINRTNWGTLRASTLVDPWVENGDADNVVKNSKIPQWGDGKHVDVIVADDGAGWIGHPEFNRDTEGEKPNGYTGGNLLPGNGSCDVLDLCLDAPYYLDPDYFNADEEYNNGAVGNVTGNGSDFFKREVTTNGVRIMGAGGVGGQVAVPDAWLEKVARMFELFLDPNGAGINQTFQRSMIKTLSGDAGTYHAGLPTIQRVARGAGSDYSTNFLTDAGIIFWNLTDLFDNTVQNDMVWYLNSTGDGYGDGDIDAQEVIEHVFHTLHMHGLPADDIKLYQFLADDWDTSDLYAAMEEAYDAGKWDPSGYQSPADDWKTNSDAFEVAAKEYLFLLNFAMFEYTELWDGGSLAPEWTDDMRTQAGILANNPLGYAFHNTWIAPVISKPSLATIRNIFQDGNTPDQDDPTQAGASGYVVDISRLETRWDGTVVPVESFARGWWTNASNRSSAFTAKYPSAGTTASITSSYTRAYNNGTNASASTSGQHCTPCMALTYGRTQGWAYNANKWVLNLYGTNSVDIEPGFDMQKIFHNVKPINPTYGTQDPTVSSNSWGYRATKAGGTNYHHFQGGAATSYTSETGINWLSHMGSQGDLGRWKSEMKTNSLTTALDELCDSGVIFVCAAGNSNQKQTNWGHPDFDNYISPNSDDTIEESSYSEFGVIVTGTTNRRGFPQQGGMTTSPAVSYTIDAINAGSGAYTLSSGTDRDGAVAGDNASIRIALGDTISITNNASASHPMYFKTAQGSGTGDQVVGATGQGASGGSTVSWTPTTRGTYYYQCSVHGAMNGTITVLSPKVSYKTINIGALDDDHSAGAKERKVGYSDRGNGIDLYAPADGILSANNSYTPENPYPATYTGLTANTGSGAGVPEDTGFSGTSAACPCAAGFISTLVQFNRDWTYADIKTYLSNMPGQTTGNFYYGTESTSLNDSNWLDYPSIETTEAPKVIYQDATQFKQTVFPKRKSSMKSGLRTSGVQINYIQKWDRG